jgi:hypothetical protein
MPTALSQLVDFGTGRIRQHTLRRIFIPLIVVAYLGSLMLAIQLFPGPFDWRTRSRSKLVRLPRASRLIYRSRAMADVPNLQRYCAQDRDEVFDLFREALGAEGSARTIAQFRWKYETNPFTPAEGPAIDLIRIGPKLVSLLAGFSIPMWMGGTECAGEGRGTWIVHPDYRGRNLWKQVNDLISGGAPVQFGWTRLPPRVSMNIEYVSDALRPMLRILDAGTLIGRFTNSRILTAMGSSAGAATHSVLTRLAGHHDPVGAVVRLPAFDNRVDELWQRARRTELAMTVRNHRYLNWRYCARPDAQYLLYGFERGDELAGFLVARAFTYLGVRWGYLVDFLAPENSTEVLRALVGQAIEDFRNDRTAAVSCFVNDSAARRALLRYGFLPVPQRRPIRFVRLIPNRRPDLIKFRDAKRWYLTMGDGDLELAP